MGTIFVSALSEEDFPSLSELERDLADLGVSPRPIGRLGFRAYEIGKINSLSVELRSKEHAPPHFHITDGTHSASFTIQDCERLAGNGFRARERKIRKWWKNNKPLLIEKWNETRPSDCPVGKIRDAG